MSAKDTIMALTYLECAERLLRYSNLTKVSPAVLSGYALGYWQGSIAAAKESAAVLIALAQKLIGQNERPT